MTQQLFVERRESDWRHLDEMLARVGRRGIRGLAPGEVAELGGRYRSLAGDLAYAQGRGYDPRLLAYLNRLVARAHAVIYGANTQAGSARIARFYTHTFPREFRRSIVPIVLCAALTVVCAVVAYAVIGSHPADAYALLPKGMIPPEIRKSLHNSNFNFDTGNSPLAASEIITNNVKVAVLAFAGSVTLGILTVYIIATNGLMVGGLGAMFANAGFGYDFWATVAPHGAIELTAIQIAGAAGLLIAAGIIAPGRLRRRDAIRANAARAGVLFAGVASMLVVAGTIEGFFSPLRLPADARIVFGCVTAILLAAYFTFAGRSNAAELQ
ncbi:MAG TPA: stage II sporulation protein M [Candidatus Dormibacteraeota bacterium]|nr:stage II sporulation protein M [Candidatus Dormibacteraeota bacterium]